jgi:hypothetical protein
VVFRGTRHASDESFQLLRSAMALRKAGWPAFGGRAGVPPVIVPGGPPMLLTATGAEQRRALVLILHESSKPPTTLVHDWTPKGLCKN